MTGRHLNTSETFKRWVQWVCLLAALAAPFPVAAEDRAEANVYLFWIAGCPHCEREINFLRHLEQEQPQVQVKYFEIAGGDENRELFLEVIRLFGISEPAVPMTIIGNQVWMGYSTDISTGSQMRARVATCLRADCPDAIAGLIEGRAVAAPPAMQTERVPIPEKLHVPLLGEIAPHNLSLPVLTVVLGALDGFNPCAMWTLVFLIGLLIGMKDSLRMWTLGSAFIIGSAAVYFVFMAAWLNLLLFLGGLLFIRVVIGLVALGGGAYYLREFILNKDAVCAVTAPEQRQRVFNRLKALAQKRSFLIALVGILTLAVLVNLVELICSAGIPAVYTQILAMHALPRWQYYGYLLLYILVFMADDLLVFVTAMLTLRVSGITTQYSRYSHLIGGVVLVIIGALLLLRPELLMLG